MFKKVRLTCLLLGVAGILATGCSKNNQDVTSTISATVVQVRYACGPACDALGFVIKNTSNELFTPISLGSEFRMNNLPVKIRFKYTGKIPERYTAPGYEMIEIIQISR